MKNNMQNKIKYIVFFGILFYRKFDRQCVGFDCG
ncbi:hypothetical protein GYH30_024290 [Glycine max]|nr:hypothetical protein GYH30_024290 [Glycine max]